MKEACLILLQTIPGTIDMEIFEKTLLTKFPQIVSYHDLHIWQLSANKYIATVHIIFQDSKQYAKVIDEVRTHFHDHHIAHVTIQPEFYDQCDKASTTSVECMVQCKKNECLDKVCCKDSMTDLREVSVCPGAIDGAHDHAHATKNNNKKHCGHNHHNAHKHGHSHDHKHDRKQAHGHSHGHNHSHGEHDHILNTKPSEKVPNDSQIRINNSHNLNKDAAIDKTVSKTLVKQIEEEKSSIINRTEKTEIFKSNEATTEQTPVNSSTASVDKN